MTPDDRWVADLLEALRAILANRHDWTPHPRRGERQDLSFDVFRVVGSGATARLEMLFRDAKRPTECFGYSAPLEGPEGLVQALDGAQPSTMAGLIASEVEEHIESDGLEWRADTAVDGIVWI